jgi:hypothetical protein
VNAVMKIIDRCSKSIYVVSKSISFERCVEKRLVLREEGAILRAMYS